MKKILTLLFICILALINSFVVVFAGDEYVILNRKNNTYHKVNCEYGLMASNVELINKPLLPKYKPASCCYPESVKHQKAKN